MLAEIVALLKADPVLAALLPTDPDTGEPSIYTQWSPQARQPYITIMYDETMVGQMSGTVGDGTLDFNCWDAGTSLARVQEIGFRLVDILDYLDIDTSRGHTRLKVQSSGIIPEPEPGVVRWGVTVGTRVLRSAAIEARVSRETSHVLELVDINTATAEELSELPGITGANAQGIVDYRTDNGPFAAIEDIMNVQGIGIRKYDNIKELITV